MKTLFVLGVLSSCIVTTAASPLSQASAPGTESTYLDCTGITPFWIGSWATAVIGMDKDNARLTIKLAPDGSTATLRLAHTGEQVIDLKTDGEYYYGSKPLGISSLDGRVSDLYLSINRISGETSAGFTVTDSPKDSKRIAFAGTCRRASPQF